MTKEDSLLEALGEAAKDRVAEDDRWWDAVASADAEALPSRDPTDLEALAPLDDAEQDAIAAMLAVPPAAEVEPEPNAGGAEVIPISFARRWMVPGALVAAAAAVLFVVVVPGEGPADLPSYSLQVRSGEKATRGPDDSMPGEVTVYSQGARFDFALVPRTALGADDDVAVAAFVRGDSGARAWDAPVDALDGGALRIRGTFGEELDLAAGEWELVFFVGPPSRLVSDAVAPDRPAPDGVQRFVARIRVR